MGYLEDLLQQQQLDPLVEDALRARRSEIEAILRQPPTPSAARIYYGGSLAKHTLIAAHFDLDVVVYFPHTAAPPADLYREVEQKLRQASRAVLRHNVSLRLQYTPGYHIDVVPGRAVDDTFEYANLYASDSGATRRTSLKLHIRLARESDRDVIRLLKLWRRRNAVPVGSFLIELATARILSGAPAGLPLENRLRHVLQFFAVFYPEARFTDPANTNNIVSADIHWSQKQAVAQAAQAALQAPWPRSIW